MDIFSKVMRSKVMRSVRGSDTKIEVAVANHLRARGLAFQKNVATLPGKPDIVLPEHNTIVFVNGCFWHGHRNCKEFRLPQSRTDFWLKKINANVFRDAKNNFKLKSLGWQVLTLWECQLKKDLAGEMLRLERRLPSHW